MIPGKQHVYYIVHVMLYVIFCFIMFDITTLFVPLSMHIAYDCFIFIKDFMENAGWVYSLLRKINRKSNTKENN